MGNGNGPITLNNKPLENKSYIIYEDVSHSDLSSYIINYERGFSEKQAKLIFKKILYGVNAIHHANICHRDLKPENILLDNNYNPIIIGFHLSAINIIPINIYIFDLCSIFYYFIMFWISS